MDVFIQSTFLERRIPNMYALSGSINVLLLSKVPSLEDCKFSMGGSRKNGNTIYGGMKAAQDKPA